MARGSGSGRLANRENRCARSELEGLGWCDTAIDALEQEWDAHRENDGLQNPYTPHTVVAKNFEGDDDTGCVDDCRPLYLSHRYSEQR